MRASSVVEKDASDRNGTKNAFPIIYDSFNHPDLADARKHETWPSCRFQRFGRDGAMFDRRRLFSTIKAVLLQVKWLSDDIRQRDG
jgi:hypothetical protein